MVSSGLKGVHRSTLSDANTKRDSRIFEDLFCSILGRCRDLTPRHRFRFNNPLYTIDATTIDLCLSVFTRARFRKAKGAIKMRCLYDHSGALPSFLTVTDGKRHDVTEAKNAGFPLSPDSIVSVDRAYIDYTWPYSLNAKRIWFVTRAKSSIDYTVTGQHPVSGKGIIRDERISLAGQHTRDKHPGDPRLIRFYDEKRKKTLVFLTNNFRLVAAAIARIYKSRWRIELFFKWIKQNLKIKSFLGTSRNAVMTQIWLAMCYYLLLTYIKYQTRYAYSLLQLGRIIRETLFDRKSLVDILTVTPEHMAAVRNGVLQGTLF